MTIPPVAGPPVAHRLDEALAVAGLGDSLVTGEAVVLEVRPASFAARGLAAFLDYLLLGALSIGVVLAVGPVLGDLDEAASTALALAMLVTLFLFVPVTVETLTRGRSFGKWALGLRVLQDDGSPVRVRHCAVRALLAVLEIYTCWGGIALVTSLANRRGKRLGDLLAGTYVARERGGGYLTSAVPMPAELYAWALSADLGRVPDRLAVLTRAFLGRAPALDPASRERVATALADEVARFVAPSPPPGTWPERYLAAVLAERQRRDLDRLWRQAVARALRQDHRGTASVLSPASTRLVGE